MSTSLHDYSDLEHIEFELTLEQTEVPVQAAAWERCAPELEPLPVEVPTDPLPLFWHEAMSPEGGKRSLPLQETKALDNYAVPLPTSHERSLGSNHQSRQPLRSGRVELLVHVLLLIGLLGGIAYVRQVGDEPIRVAQKVDPNPARVGVERAPTVPSGDSEALRVKNPFDQTEAFEFPPGTSKAEAREAVAKLLMERAHDRLPVLTEASHRRGAIAKHETQESSPLQDSQYRNSQAALGRRPG